ncbi:MAG: 1-(5-phosphoribosyl)-5-amino-4-imidazole-carboxylate carboxylase [Deltaproteobacteria bacterium]|nr:1-(5-phosphoribosyl)-5-amino-4-imidazole-carboxylate carboxylase [Deltaproteobacteria bacterium]
MDEKDIRDLLEHVRGGEVSLDDAVQTLKRLPYATLDIARLDHHRALRRGFPEVICGLGKSPEGLADIFAQLCAQHEIVLCTRAQPAHIDELKRRELPHSYDPASQILFHAPDTITNRGRGKIAVVAAGTSDLYVAKEALWTARLMGNETELILDVGVAGLHRLLGELDRIQEAEVLIVVAGMEGALPSVLGGLTDRPIISVPTSIGYGTGAHGKAALLSMLNSCVPGISVVNVDNGFGAGYAAALHNRRRAEQAAQDESLDIATLFQNEKDGHHVAAL